jgi:digeranylgeranylglycerophospholipid reductase
VHLGSFAPGFFAWLIPLSPTEAKIGLGSFGRAAGRAQLSALLRERFPGAVARRIRCAPIPLGAPLSGIARDGVALVGDAAFHAKATSGGGIVFGMQAARVLADSIAEHLRGGSPLAYERRLGPLARELRLHWAMRRFFNLLSPDQTDRLLATLKRRGIEAFLEEEGDMDRPSTFLPKLLLRPDLWLPLGGSLGRLRAALGR